MNVLVEIQQQLDQFTDTDKQVAQFILKDPENFAQQSAQSVANQLGVSSATLVRFSRQLGLKGFTELKQRVTMAAVTLSGTTALQEVAQQDTVQDIKQKTRVRLIHMSDQTNQLLEDQAVDDAVNLIGEHKTLFVYGIGASGLVAQDLFQKFSRLGVRIVYHEDSHLMVTMLAANPENACALFVSNSGETSDIMRLVKVAENFEMPIIGLTGDVSSSLAKHADVILHSVAGESLPLRTAATISLMAQLYVVDIVFYAYVVAHFDDSMRAIKNSKATMTLIEPSRTKRDK